MAWHRHFGVSKAWGVALAYLAFGVTWVVGTDWLLLAAFQLLSPEQVTAVASFKGTVFVLLSAALIFFLVRRLLGTLEERAARLAESEARYRGLVETQHEIVARFDSSGHFTFINDTGCRILGLSRRALLGQSWQTLVHPDDVAFSAAAEMRAQTPPLFQAEVENRIRAKDGDRWYAWSGYGVFDDNGTVIETQVVGRDMTERRLAAERVRQAEAAIRASEELYRSLFLNMLEGYACCRMVYDDNGTPVDFTYLSVNPAFESMTGLKDAVGRKVSEVIPGIHFSNPELLEIYGRVAATGQPERFESYLKTLDIWLSVSVFSTVTGTFVAVFDNVTERKLRELELREARAAAESANAAKSRFLATMSHELRTPLNALLGFVDLVRSETYGGIDPQYQEHAEDAYHSGRHLIELISDILEMSRLEAGKVKLELVPLSARSVVEASVRLVRDSLSKRQLVFDLAVAPETPPFQGDEKAMRQIVSNLLSNAIKFTPDGGRITVTASADHRCLALTVSDTGIGIPADQLDRVVLPFEQLENPLTRCHDGTGLGLPIARSLTELHGGLMSIISAVGAGTAVTVTLPLAE